MARRRAARPAPPGHGSAARLPAAGAGRDDRPPERRLRPRDRAALRVLRPADRHAAGRDAAGPALRGLLAVLVLASTAASAFALQTFLSRCGGPRGRSAGGPERPGLRPRGPRPARGGAVGRPAGRRERVAWGAVIVLLVTGVAFTLSRGAAARARCPVLWAAGPPARAARWRSWPAGLALGLVLAAVAVTAPELVERALMQKERVAGRNVDTRALRWAAAAQMTVDSPLAGHGPGRLPRELRALRLAEPAGRRDRRDLPPDVPRGRRPSSASPPCSPS